MRSNACTVVVWRCGYPEMCGSPATGLQEVWADVKDTEGLACWKHGGPGVEHEGSMAHDKDGNLLPLMLSDLVQIAQAALAEHGDMPVGVETCVAGYEFNEEHSLPVSDLPSVSSPRWIREYWIGQDTRAFVLSGA